MASDPTYVRAFKEFTKTSGSPTSEQRLEMEKEFYGESDRACVILQASWTELMVERAVRSRLRGTRSGELFGRNGPLSNFSNKISMAYSMGIFAEKTRHDLTLIRELRNGFAHCQLPLRFKMPIVKTMCDNMQLPDLDEHRAIPNILDRPIEGDGQWHDRDHPRERYMICCHTIITGMFHTYLYHPLEALPRGSDLP